PDGGSVSFEVVPESLEKTTLGGLRAGDIVNIERALRAGETFGGHYVTGHVDGIGEIVKIERQGDQSLFRVSTAPGLIEQMLDKGSVSVDGASLTIVEVARKEGWFSFAAIPHTMERTILGRASEGGEVNIETDAFGKWALHGLQCLRGDGVPDERGGPLIGMFEEGGSMKSPRDDSASGPVGE
ncbi:MAG: riboflavin synthase, partial [Planctomycetes bacterium]|nr:riboflavin synthase [Planctomycetota bacterium]